MFKEVFRCVSLRVCHWHFLIFYADSHSQQPTCNLKSDRVSNCRMKTTKWMNYILIFRKKKLFLVKKTYFIVKTLNVCFINPFFIQNYCLYNWNTLHNSLASTLLHCITGQRSNIVQLLQKWFIYRSARVFSMYIHHNRSICSSYLITMVSMINRRILIAEK